MAITLPRKSVLEAIRLGCPEVGFSGRSYTFFGESYCMTQAGTQEYIAVIRVLQEKYRGKIRILLGVEQDFYSNAPTDEYDYVIGSVHYVKKRWLLFAGGRKQRDSDGECPQVL